MSLTAYPQGSIRQLLAIAIPLMLSSLSGMVMTFVDRMMLIRYSLEAHNAVVEAINLSWVFIAGVSMLASISQTFVAQNYGAGLRGNQLSPPVWQMIWLSLGLILIFWPLSFWGTPLFFGTSEAQEMQRLYFSWMLFFVPFHGLFNALSGFFIGQGLMRLPSAVILVGNLINVALGYVLIFGVEGWVPSMGVVGAAIGLNASLFLQVAVLLFGFIRHLIQSKQGSILSYAAIKLSLLKQCLTVGSPTALFSVLETLGWSCFYMMMASLGAKHLTVAGIVQNVLILFYFVGCGLSRAVSTVAGHAIGANQLDMVRQTVRSAFWIVSGLGVALAVILAVGNDWIISCFIDNLPEEQYELLYPALLFGLANAIIYKFLEWIRMVIAGALSAAADTTFLLVAGTTSIWAFMVFPIYMLVVRLNGTIEFALTLCSVYTLLSAILYAWRFYTGGWRDRERLVLSTESMLQAA